MFRDWENFYLLVGGAAGALIGLMFVVATLTAEIKSKSVVPGSRVYVTPIVFHFSVVLVVSAISAVPALSPAIVGVLLVISAAFGFAYSAATTVRLFHGEWETAPDRSDKFFYGIFPAIAYFGLAAAATAAIWFDPGEAAYCVGAITLILLLVGIRNAWDLATFFVLRSSSGGE